ncbi:hypothetical protein QQ045_029704 [Rhodiola kirilowii]
MRIARSSSTGAGGLNRKRFTDITNIKRQPQHEEEEQEGEEDIMCPPISPSTQIYIDTLIKENMTLMRLIGERNKLIDLSGAEMLKMKTNMQRLQLQNLNLAQSNSFMLAVRSLSIKSLQHEIICKDAMLKALKSVSPVTQEAMDDDPLLDAVLQIQRRSGGITRSHSMSRCTTLQRGGSERDTAENKSPMSSFSGCCMRSRSARFKSQRSYARQHFFELDDPDYLAYQAPDHSTQSRTQAPSESYSITKTSHKDAERVKSCREVPISIRLRD